MSSLIYIGHVIKGENDGGMARNKAFLEHFQKNEAKIFDLYDKVFFIRIFKLISFFLRSFFFKGEKIFIHLGTIYNIFPKPILRVRLGLWFFDKFIKSLAKRNRIFLEINDLPMEQAKDLDLFQEVFYDSFQKIIFNNNLKINYIFAAHEMEKYTIEKYKLDRCFSQVVINGAPELLKSTKNLSSVLDTYKKYDYKFVYVGTLAKGRGVNELINLFKEANSYLVLVGSGGEWLPDKLRECDNIIYLGSFSEQEALQISSQCDYGIIHYDSSKLYYNICYPTKNSFYISAGINVISTKLIETENVIGKYNVFLFEDFLKWKNIITDPLPYFAHLNKIGENLKEKFYWKNILDEMKIN